MAKILIGLDEMEQTTRNLLVIPEEEKMEDNPNFRKVLDEVVGEYLGIDTYRENDEDYTDIEEEYNELLDNLADGNNDRFDDFFLYYEDAPIFNGTEELEY